MKMLTGIRALTLLLFFLASLFVGCSNNNKATLTRDTLEKVQKGMDEDQVKKILGEPKTMSRNSLPPPISTSYTIYIYDVDSQDTSITFENGKVTKAEMNNRPVELK